ncbi:hypothetical protein [Chelatococcus asaccharovorans]|uniref:hypothetical protein n=1 Tax=Chelatococcus asaccharovorans TaxID=28210 RepID=UPI003CC93156
MSVLELARRGLLFGRDEPHWRALPDLVTGDITRGRGLAMVMPMMVLPMMVMTMMVVSGGGTNSAANRTCRGACVGEDTAHGDEAAAAVRAATEAAISLRGAAWLGRIFVCQGAADFSIGDDVAVADDHNRSSLEQFKKSFCINNLLMAVGNSRPRPATESTVSRAIGQGKSAHCGLAPIHNTRANSQA